MGPTARPRLSRRPGIRRPRYRADRGRRSALVLAHRERRHVLVSWPRDGLRLVGSTSGAGWHLWRSAVLADRRGLPGRRPGLATTCWRQRSGAAWPPGGVSARTGWCSPARCSSWWLRTLGRWRCAIPADARALLRPGLRHGGAVSVDLVLIGLTYVRFIRPGVLTVADLGLRSDRLRVRRRLRPAARGRRAGHQRADPEWRSRPSACSRPSWSISSASATSHSAAFWRSCSRVASWPRSAEELYFRGFVFRTLPAHARPAVAYIATSLLFAALHLNLAGAAADPGPELDVLLGLSQDRQHRAERRRATR